MIIHILIVLLLLYFTLYTRFYYKITDNNEILQLDSIHAPNLHSSILEGRILVVIVEPSTVNIPEYDYEKTLLETPYTGDISFISNISPSLSVSVRKYVSVLPKLSHHPLVSNHSDRNYYFVVSGIVRFYIFHPKYKHLLYTKSSKTNNHNNKLSSYNLFSDDHSKYPLASKAQYIEMIVRENTLIYIPRFFWYCYRADENAIVINIQTNTICSNILLSIGG